ncbi:cell envelope integrity protein TolA [Enterobacter roggenkampii]|uniref:cell envelope integrity protein TolA n=1 Tax=Enterobacter roggenkampii TaxID=1812935 RepID=UPI0020765443|nr:cell envelope integrity protein TolA [Enterobacter roggenkampii]MCM7081024.1 cell envelope biogenesis protein TolA [Enterobacter roggenkampii]
MSRFVYMMVVLFLAGCHGHKQHQLTTKQQQELPVLNRWAVSFKEAVEQRFPSASDYKGKECSIRVHQPKGSRKITSMHVTEGNPELCMAATKAIQAASDDGVLPLTPGPIGEEFPLDFKP